MSKLIRNHFELVSVCRSAGLWYVGSFMLEVLICREQWEDEATKQDFIRHMFTEYSGIDKDIGGTRTRVNSLIRIIESKKVAEAMALVIEASDKKLGCMEPKVNAQVVLDKLANGEIKC